MAGLAGFTTKAVGEDDPRGILKKMRDLMAHCSFYQDEELFCLGQVWGTYSHLAAINPEPQPLCDAGVCLWLEGEFYNQGELRKLLGSDVEVGNDAELFLHLYKQDPELSFLREIEGAFNAVVYESARGRVRLISDRDGLNQLFWTVHKGGLVWASEPKAVLALPGFTPKIDMQTVDDFLETGRPHGDGTWFEGVELFPAATVLTFDIEMGLIRKKRYWWWDEIKLLTGRIDEDELIEEFARLHGATVAKMSRTDKRLGLLLSGGLDSRGILAALPDDVGPIPMTTFGRSGCDDIAIARRVTERKGGTHHVVCLDEDNWCYKRIASVWWSDGLLDLLHVPSLTAITQLPAYCDVNLTGYRGDGVLGGEWGDCREKSLAENMEHVGRRSENVGNRMLGMHVVNRKPFCDNKLMEFIVSVPHRLVSRHKLYIKMLVRAYPEYYRDIPWQLTGGLIRWSPLRRKAHCALRMMKNRIAAMLQLGDTHGYNDYAGWIRRGAGHSLFREVLTAKSPLYAEYIDRDMVVDEWQRHLGGEDNCDVLFRVLTVETYLQQVFNGKYRATDVGSSADGVTAGPPTDSATDAVTGAGSSVVVPGEAMSAAGSRASASEALV